MERAAHLEPWPDVADGDGDDGGRDHYLDLRLTAASPRLAALADEAVAVLGKHHRRASDRESHRALVTMLTANLAYAVVAGWEPPTIFTPLSRRDGSPPPSRYRVPPPRLLRDRIRDLERIGFLALSVSRQRKRASTLEPSPRLREMVAAAGIGFGDFQRDEADEETIILSLKERHYRDGPAEPERELIEYRDTPETRRLRKEVADINARLAAADLRYVGPASDRIDTYRRRLRRFYNVPPPYKGIIMFLFGGRLFGGWWQNLKSDKRRFIRIDGEPIADLDYAGMFLALAYLRSDKEPPEVGDLYAGILDSDVRRHGDAAAKERRRDAVKVVVSAFLSAYAPRREIPSAIDPSDLPAGLTADAARSAIVARHPDLADLLETGAGLALMRTESDILVAVLLRLADEGITALPMHDGIMVAERHDGVARGVMRDVSAELAGFPLRVERKA